MMSCRALLSSSLLVLLAACQGSPSVAPPASPAVPTEATEATEARSPAAAATPGGDKADKPKDEAKAKADAKRQKQKELRGKQRELEAAKVEQRIAELDRGVRQAAVDAALAKSASELAAAQKELEVFLGEVKPRELEERRIGLDQSTYRAEHSKDELGELTAMYEADEFARTTKELVLKRGRRELEMAERSLAIAKKEVAHFETMTLPNRERELRQKLADAELERRKAEAEHEKAKLELELATVKAQHRLSDLTEDIADLQEQLAREQS
jgi:hypothetical protein